MGIELCLLVLEHITWQRLIFFKVMRAGGASLSLKTPSQENIWFMYPIKDRDCGIIHNFY